MLLVIYVVDYLFMVLLFMLLMFVTYIYIDVVDYLC